MSTQVMTTDETGRTSGSPGAAARSPVLVDALVALAVLAYNLPVQGLAGPVWTLLLPLGLCLPYVLRRRHPRAVLATMLLVAVVQQLAGVELLVADVMLLLAVYGVARRELWPWSLPAAGLVAGWVLWAVAPRLEEYYLSVLDLVLLVVVVAAAWLAGTLVRTRAQYVESLRLRAEQLERARAVDAEMAAAAERTRIARELHDVVSHGLSAIGLLAEGAALQVDQDPDRARAAMLRVRDTSRDAMQEMRSMLSVLRDAGTDGPSPLPGLDQLPELVERAAGLGLPVRLTVEGERPPLRSSLQLVVYRVVQEALTNVGKHAGERLGRVDVSLRYGEDELSVTVTDDGPGPSTPGAGAARPDDPPGGGAGEGQGLVGMRERVTAHGGTLSTGPGPDGGFCVRATLPVRSGG
ncbi:sensor histidine kinase [Auraticoccus sp. F435]|uniref:histidine kinase n=1 Tax=Auraticoccus cholistanensis TaxID=2656650 RepID=A0A6A9UPQ9_9ACTN|nr:sensor histidine kinase [Auraticoccus cholistanensis]MVA74528.1 sensor histidine kinase [Auraticoccus cholistanensis]